MGGSGSVPAGQHSFFYYDNVKDSVYQNIYSLNYLNTVRTFR
jgi:hypothetical protein